MGQYYKAVCIDVNGEQMTFCPQNAICMTKHGLTEIAWKDRPDDYFECLSGMKLTEHAWMGNDFVSGVVETIWDNPQKVAWVGDYADEPEDFVGAYTTDVYHAAWCSDEPSELPFDSLPEVRDSGFLVNHSRFEYVDLARYREASSFEPSWDRGHTWCAHPLPLLTCIGNGRGGGDYHGTCMEMVGRWAMDVIGYTEDVGEAMRMYESGAVDLVSEGLRFVEVAP